MFFSLLPYPFLRVKKSSLSTDSNRSSICSINDFPNEYTVFKGPFIGQGIALADCTPCPYDKDALVFKKGDVVNIIAKNDSGTWIGMANGKIGHFKFINVEEISSLGTGMKSDCLSFCSVSSSTLNSSSTGETGSETSELSAHWDQTLGFDTSSTSSNNNNPLLISDSMSSLLNTSSTHNNNNNNSSSRNPSPSLNNNRSVAIHHEETIRHLLATSVKTHPENSLKDLLKTLGLEGFDYLTRLKEKGFTSLGSLMNITDSSILEIVGISNSDHQSTLLSIASAVRKFAHSNLSETTHSIGNASSTPTSPESVFTHPEAISSLETDLSSLTLKPHPNLTSTRSTTQSAPSTPAYESFQKSLSFTPNTTTTVPTATVVPVNQSTHSSHEPNNNSVDANSILSCNEKISSTPPAVPPREHRNSHHFSTTISVSSSSAKENHSALRLRKRRDRRASETREHIKRTASGSDILDDDLYSRYHRKSLDTNALVKKLEHGYENSTVSRAYEPIYGSGRKLSSSKSVFDLKYHSDLYNNTNISNHNNNHLVESETPVHGSTSNIHFTKKLFKKFLNSTESFSSPTSTTPTTPLPTSSSSTTTTNPTSTSTSSTLNSSSSSAHQSRKSIHSSTSTANDTDARCMGIISRPLSTALLDTLSNILMEENIDLTLEPYSDSSGFCGIPPALVQRYAEELETDVYDIAETLDYIRLCSLINKAGRQGIPNDFLADSCNGPGTDLANYESLHAWLLSLGLPMYEVKLKDCGYKNLWDVMALREDDLIGCGITNKRHRRSLTTAISALSVNQHKIEKI